MKPSALTTHVLDTGRGAPAVGVTVELYRLEGNTATLLATRVTNQDGRTDSPLLTAESFTTGIYELRFDIGAYYGEEGFFEIVPVRVRLMEGQGHYHVPLIISRYSYGTYRGS